MSKSLHPFEAYKLYHRIRFFFKTDWFWIGKTDLNFSYGKFEGSKNLQTFESLSKMYDETEMEYLFIANML